MTHLDEKLTSLPYPPNTAVPFGGSSCTLFGKTIPTCFCLVVISRLLVPFPLPWRASCCKGQKKFPGSDRKHSGSQGDVSSVYPCPCNSSNTPTPQHHPGPGKQRWSRMRTSPTSQCRPQTAILATPVCRHLGRCVSYFTSCEAGEKVFAMTCEGRK